MIERAVHFLFFEHGEATLAVSIAFYLSVLLLINAGAIVGAARRRAVRARW